MGDTSKSSRLAILISGGGRTLTNIADAIERRELDASIALVIASAECPGATLARERGFPVEIIPGVIFRDVLDARLHAHRVDWIILAGYLKLLNIPASYRGRVFNIHPALLPKFGGHGMYGRKVHEAVLAAGEKETGCTVHFCDDEFDTGPIILQRKCQVLPGDTPETLAARVFEEEKRAYPDAIARLIAGTARFEPRQT